jgi:hypothetical protein
MIKAVSPRSPGSTRGRALRAAPSARRPRRAVRLLSSARRPPLRGRRGAARTPGTGSAGASGPDWDRRGRRHGSRPPARGRGFLFGRDDWRLWPAGHLCMRCCACGFSEVCLRATAAVRLFAPVGWPSAYRRAWSDAIWDLRRARDPRRLRDLHPLAGGPPGVARALPYAPAVPPGAPGAPVGVAGAPPDVAHALPYAPDDPRAGPGPRDDRRPRPDDLARLGVRLRVRRACLHGPRLARRLCLFCP